MAIAWELVKGKWNPPKDTHPSFQGRNILITGANVGIGLEAAVKFVQLDAARVVLGVRTLSKGELAKQEIEKRTGRKGVVDVWHLDMLDYTTIKAFADRAESELDHLDVAVLNAGVIMPSFEPSKYGHETTMQVNVLSTVLLATLLLPKLKASRTETYTPVLEIIGSSNHYMITKLEPEDRPFAAYNVPSGFKSGPNQYSVSKLFLMYALPGLVRLASAADGTPEVFVTVVCPGATRSDLARNFNQWYMQLAARLFSHLQRETEEGARTYISGVCQGADSNGRFWKDDRVREQAQLLVGEKGPKLQNIVWKEIVEGIRKDVPDFEPSIPS